MYDIYMKNKSQAPDRSLRRLRGGAIRTANQPIQVQQVNQAYIRIIYLITDLPLWISLVGIFLKSTTISISRPCTSLAFTRSRAHTR